MSPPGFVALSEVTGDPKYREFAHSEYFVTTDLLFREFDDMPGGLYLRDSSFDDTMYDTEENKLDENGNLIFWSRGNGWVFAGLPAILRALPEDFAERDRCFTLLLFNIGEKRLIELLLWLAFGPRNVAYLGFCRVCWPLPNSVATLN